LVLKVESEDGELSTWRKMLRIFNLVVHVTFSPRIPNLSQISNQNQRAEGRGQRAEWQRRKQEQGKYLPTILLSPRHQTKLERTTGEDEEEKKGFEIWRSEFGLVLAGLHVQAIFYF
jgi:hypothetical protein